ncbi:MAG: hypothetical protein LUD72_00530 [Bacteroidales bacterium]|nr:hypothetical protein [Bacteroidales bacterium]
MRLYIGGRKLKSVALGKGTNACSFTGLARIADDVKTAHTLPYGVSGVAYNERRTKELGCGAESAGIV